MFAMKPIFKLVNYTLSGTLCWVSYGSLTGNEDVMTNVLEIMRALGTQFSLLF